MTKIKNTDKIKANRKLILSLLEKKYKTDYEASIAEFPKNKKTEFVEHLLDCLDSVDIYLSSPTSENWKVYAEKENTFLKKQGKRLKVYRQKKMSLYYGDCLVLLEKEIYTSDEWNLLSGEEQELSTEEFKKFIRACRNMLYQERDFLLLEQNPEDEQEEGKTKETINGIQKEKVKKGKLKREAHDKLTCLSKEQTALLLHYMQQARIILKDEYLNNTEAGEAFEILTGYSKHTIRQDLGKFNIYQNKENLTRIDTVLTHLKIAIGNALREQ